METCNAKSKGREYGCGEPMDSREFVRFKSGRVMHRDCYNRCSANPRNRREAERIARDMSYEGSADYARDMEY